MTKVEANKVFEEVQKRGLHGWVEQAVLKNDNAWTVVVSQMHNKKGELAQIKPKYLMTIEEATTFLANDIVRVVT